MKKKNLALFITFHIISGINGSQCKSETKCELFKPLQPEEPSIFVINAAGRLGNHLMAFAIVMTLAKTLKIRPFVQKETAEYLSKYFIAENIPIYEDAFCNAILPLPVHFGHGDERSQCGKNTWGPCSS